MLYKVIHTFEDDDRMGVYLVTRPPVSVETRRRVDAAKRLFQRKVEERVRANAGLDTAWGRRAIKAARELHMSGKALPVFVRIRNEYVTLKREAARD